MALFRLVYMSFKWGRLGPTCNNTSDANSCNNNTANSVSSERDKSTLSTDTPQSLKHVRGKTLQLSSELIKYGSEDIDSFAIRFSSSEQTFRSTFICLFQIALFQFVIRKATGTDSSLFPTALLPRTTSGRCQPVK